MLDRGRSRLLKCKILGGIYVKMQARAGGEDVKMQYRGGEEEREEGKGLL